MESDRLPPTGKGRRYEIRAIGLRDFAGLARDDSPLDPFDPVQYAKHNLLVVGSNPTGDILSFIKAEKLLKDSVTSRLFNSLNQTWKITLYFNSENSLY